MADQIRVLIVDDIAETRDHLTKLLGFESDIEVVGAAASGDEALELTTRLLPDVVLMDINMPDVDGKPIELPLGGERDAALLDNLDEMLIVWLIQRFVWSWRRELTTPRKN